MKFLIALMVVAVLGDEQKNAEDFLQHYGYLNPYAFDGSADVSTAISTFQRFYGLNVTGYLNQQTKTEMGKPRCGFPDIITKGNAYYSTRSKWRNNQVTYAYDNLGDLRELSESKKKAAVRKAFGLWAGKSPLHFREVASKQGNINIGWYTGYNHGKRYDSGFRQQTWGVLAHAFFPPNGDLHFDEMESWVVNGEGRGPDLVELAAHEIGHAIGIEHSNVRGTVMWPSYLRYRPNLQLHEDDTRAVRSLYGNGVGSVDGGGITGTGGTGTTGGGNCVDTGRYCSYHVPRGDCHTIDVVKEKCKKSCKLC